MPARSDAARPQSLPLSAPDPSAGVDEVEQALIRMLQEDGRTTYADLAAAAGVTEKTAHRKVGRLLDQQVIKIVAVTDPAVLGYGAMALLSITLSTGSRARDVAERLAELPQVDYISITSGRYPLHVEVLGRDHAELAELIDEVIRVLPGVRDIDVVPYLRLHYQQARFHAAERNRDLGVRPTALDALDRQIVERLARNGRAPFIEIAEHVGVTQARVRQRLQKLTSTGVVKVMAIANPLHLGYQAVAWAEIKVAGGHSADSIAEELTALPGVSYVALTIGRCDVLAEFVCTDHEELQVLLNERVRLIDGIRDIEVSQYFGLLYKPLLHPAPETAAG